MGLREIFATGTFSFDKVGNRVKPETVDTKIEPEIVDLGRRASYFGIVIVQIGLMGKEPVPEIGFGNRIVGPVTKLVVLKDDPSFLIFCGFIGPYIVITPGVSGRRPTRFLKPKMLIAGVI